MQVRVDDQRRAPVAGAEAHDWQKRETVVRSRLAQPDAELRAAIQTQLGVGLGETTSDGRFTLLPIVCLGACDRGPALMVDADLHGPVAPPEVGAILEAYQ